MTLRLLGEPQEDRRLRRMIFISAILHVLVIIWVLTSSSLSRSLQPRAVAYTVELVNPDRLGANLPGGERKNVSTSGESVSSTKTSRTSLPSLTSEKPQPKITMKEKPKHPSPPQPKVEKTPEKEKPVEKPLAKPEPEKTKTAEKKSDPQPIKPSPEPQKTAKADKPKPDVKTIAPKAETKKVEEKPVEPQQNNVQAVEKKKSESQKTETKSDKTAKATEKTEANQEKPVPKQAEVEKTEEKPTSPEEISADDRDRRIAAALARIQAQTRAQGSSSFPEGEKGTGPITKGGEFGEGGGGAVRGVEFLMYTQQLQKRVQENWIVTEKKPGLVASVSFMIQPNGSVQEVEMTQSSGNNAFDQSVVRAIRKAAPFPPPPLSYVQEFATQKIVMNFGGEGRVN